MPCAERVEESAILFILTLTGGVSTMRRIAGSADTALRGTTCRPIHVVCMHAV